MNHATTNNSSSKKVDAIFSVISLVGNAIKEASPLPSGTLYATLAAAGCTIQQYEQIIDAFISANKVKKINNLLYWVE